ncbi:hypothetical protein SLEP1_g7284 [Rubroshorea leprosula]|uniref:Uncharacterized protein n=1 Tax=Rubroshorea leprosula TaxID=152421 RepID=A0AAV5HXW8_9ROSI|nr:hypothetical protein SLEP1_g7284 [Rubroshorea leprosula]
MVRQTLTRSAPVNGRTQPLLFAEDSTKSSISSSRAMKGRRFAEVVGAGTAECAAVCCCCPCTVMELLVLGFYRVPAWLCRKAWKKRKRQRILKMKKKQGVMGGGNRKDLEETEETEADQVAAKSQIGVSEAEAVELEKENETLETFYGTGFWRSPSQRDM